MNDGDTIRDFLRQAEYFDSEDGADQYVEAVAALERMRRDLDGYRRALIAHHDLATLSDEVIREYDFIGCPVCRRARCG